MSPGSRPSNSSQEVAGSPAHVERRPIGLRLRDLRRAAGLNQTELAERLHIGQARMSRIELGTYVPTTDLVARVLDALDVEPLVRQDILDQLAEVHTEVRTWRRLHRGGLRKHQDRYGAMEASAAAIRCWSDRVVPALLQTADYTRAMCDVYAVPGLTDVAGIISGRELRQEILGDRRKQFTLLIGEAALRTRDVPADVMADQLDRILLLAAMRHIEVGVVPVHVMVPASTDFLVLDDRVVVIELDTTELTIRETDQVKRYLHIFECLRARAVRGADLADLLRSIGAGLTEETATDEKR